MSLLQSPLKSPTAANDSGFRFALGFAVEQDPMVRVTGAVPLALL
jgi:hypothetical protein